MKGYSNGKMYEVAIADIAVGNVQARKYFDEQGLAELTASVKRYGVLQPVLVQEGKESKFALVSGERRYRAAQAAGLATIPAVLTDGDPGEIGLVENLLREDLTVIEQAEALESLRSSHNYQLSNLCEVFGLSDSTLSEILSLNKLPAAVKDDCRKEPKIARGILVEIAKQHTEKKMQALYENYKERGLTRGEIRTLPRKAKLSAPAAGDPVDITFIDNFLKRLDALDIAKATPDQLEPLTLALENVRSSAFKKLKALKTQTPASSST
ncbi:MAG TPA: ParB/RepB/Spo0J family partition protein [Geomonas sp.]|nr:ParB/RepB/Spo0J family partition protein [Geomonas sp.]